MFGVGPIVVSAQWAEAPALLQLLERAAAVLHRLPARRAVEGEHGVLRHAALAKHAVTPTLKQKYNLMQDRSNSGSAA